MEYDIKAICSLDHSDCMAVTKTLFVENVILYKTDN